MSVSLSCWWKANPQPSFLKSNTELFNIDCDDGMQFENFCSHVDWIDGATLVTTTVDSVEVPDWLLRLLQDVCKNKQNTVICNMTVIQASRSNDPFVFDIDVSEFVRSYCSSSQNYQSVDVLSLLATIRDPPTDADHQELQPLKGSLRAGWKTGHVVICSTDNRVLLDGATRVFLLNSMLSQGISVPDEVPVVKCLPFTPAWIINAMLVLLSEGKDRRIWSPGDTLNLASYQVDSLRYCGISFKNIAIEKMKFMKVFEGFREFIDLARIVNSREICSDLARNLAMKKNSLLFYNILSPKAAVDNCMKIVAGSAFTKGHCENLMGKFFKKLKDQSSGKPNSTVVSDACNDLFRDFRTESLTYGIHVEYKHPIGNMRRLNLKWCSTNFRHQSKSHFVCASSQYSRFELWTVNPKVLIATKLVPSLVPALGCMQGNEKTAWLVESQGFMSVTVTALASDFMNEDDDCPQSEAKVAADVCASTVPETLSVQNKPEKRPRRASSTPCVDKGWTPILSEMLKYELWLSLQSFDYNSLWHYIHADGSDIPSFVVRMELRLKSLCCYHADLYRDRRFNELGSRLIEDARSIQKGHLPTLEQRKLLQRFCNEYGWFLTPVLWNRAELLFLLVYVFDPRLRFVHVIQKDAKSSTEHTQNRGMALCSNFLSQLLFERLKEFGLLSLKHKPGEAVVLDSNGSHLQHFQSRRTTDFFKAMLPQNVVLVSNAPAALSCNGLYTQISTTLYAQNVAYPQNEYQPQPRIIECIDGRWCFKHLLAHGADCWLMREARESSPNEQPIERILAHCKRWEAWRGYDGQSFHVAVDVDISQQHTLEPVFVFDFGSGGGCERIEYGPQDPDLMPQRRHTDGDVQRDPCEFDRNGTIILETPPIFTPSDFTQSETRANALREQGESYLPVHNKTSPFDGPLGALFCLMFGTSLDFTDSNMKIPIGACLLFSFLFPHRGAFYDYINRRFHLIILNEDFSRIPAGNVEQRLRVLACSKQRHIHDRVDFYDLSLLENLSSHEISPDLHPFPLERFRIVFGDEWVYTGDVNLANQPNGFGTMCFPEGTEKRCGLFQNGQFKKHCNLSDDEVVATRHVNTMYMSLNFLNIGPIANFVDAEAFFDALQALNGFFSCPNVVSAKVLTEMYSVVDSMTATRLSLFKTRAKSLLQKLYTDRASALNEQADDGEELADASVLEMAGSGDNYTDSSHMADLIQKKRLSDQGEVPAQKSTNLFPSISGNVDSLVETLTEYCVERPSVNNTQSDCTISCIWKPSELEYDLEVGFSCKIEKRGGSDVITAVKFSTSSKLHLHRSFLENLKERVLLPLYIMSPDHARLFIKQTIWLDMDAESLVEPPACPMNVCHEMSDSGVSFAIASSNGASKFSDPRYLPFIEWLDVPPTFPRGQQPPLPSVRNMFLPIEIKVIESLMQRNLKSCNSLSSRM